MRKLAFSLIWAIVASMVLTLAASASHGTTPAIVPGPYQGTFSGYLYGDKNSRAPMSLELVQLGDEVSGKLTIGEGLFIDAGRCGQASIPPNSAIASGRTLVSEPRTLQASSSFVVSGITIKGYLESELSADGKEITALAKIDLPWLCGRDPVIKGVAVRDMD